MATNADTQVEEEVISADAEEDLRKAKEESETNTETEELEQSEEGAQSEESQEESTDESNLTTESSEPEHDLDWYKKAYEESTSEALKLKKERDELKTSPPPPVIDSQEVTEGVTLTASELYIKQKQDEEIATAFSEVTKNYPQVKDSEEYKKFTAMANTFGKTILDAEKRLATPAELYAKTVIALGWTADDTQEKLGAALKDGASSQKVSSGAGQGSSTSKVTDAMIVANRKMYPGKSDTELREELEPYTT